MNQKEAGALLGVFDHLAQLKIHSLTEARCLLAIASSPTPIEVNQLSRTLKEPLSTVSRVTWTLAELKLVKYSEHPQDRRRKLLSVDFKRLNGAK